MNKPVPFLLLACLLAFSSQIVAQAPEPAAVNVEAPAGDKPADGTLGPNDTEILATDGATFASKDRIAVFNGNIRVKDPRFTLACVKLTVYLSKSSAAPGAAPTPAPAPDAKSADVDRGGGIDHAIAEGSVIIIQKRASTKPGEEEKVSIAHSDVAEFDNKTGDMTLRGMPRVEQNGNLHEALSRSTWMVLHRDNSLETHGPCRTLIVSHAKESVPGASPSASPATRRPTPGGT
jgi:lipopolysaccharide export system protein LptA